MSATTELQSVLVVMPEEDGHWIRGVNRDPMDGLILIGPRERAEFEGLLSLRDTQQSPLYVSSTVRDRIRPSDAVTHVGKRRCRAKASQQMLPSNDRSLLSPLESAFGGLKSNTRFSSLAIDSIGESILAGTLSCYTALLTDMTILFLHGWHSVPGGVKPTYLKDHGHIVINPALDDDDFAAALATAQGEFDQHQPQVVVGSSRGGAVAMNINSGDAKLVLLCPAWRNWGTAKTVKPGTVILHSRDDDVIPFADSEELVRNSGLPGSALIEVGNDHRLADQESLARMLRACGEGATTLNPCDVVRAVSREATGWL